MRKNLNIKIILMIIIIIMIITIIMYISLLTVTELQNRIIRIKNHKLQMK